MTFNSYAFHGCIHATIISEYFPIMTNQDDVKDQFYEELHAFITSVS